MDMKLFEKEFNEIFSKNLKHYMDSRNVTQNELAKFLGVSPTSVNNWYNGYKTPRMDKVDKICRFFNINRSDLMTEKREEPSNVSPIPVTDTVQIPVYGKVPAGLPAEAIEYIEDTIDIPIEWTRGGQEYMGLIVKGDSMYPKYLDGDTVVVRLQPDCESGQDCVVYVNGFDSTLKRVIKEKDGIMLQPLNPEYVPKKYDCSNEQNTVTILGVVVELRRKI